ncbi:class I SAM-dependent methyltransferase [Endozoicomonadaceae bacterium StTr2]
MDKLRVRYQTIELGDDIDIHLRTLRDRQQYYDHNGIAAKAGISSALWPLFGIVWPSSIVLAHYLLNYPTENKRILEVGCGIGLASLTLNHLQADITATDYHPEAGNFLEVNNQLNGGSPIPFRRIDWNQRHPGLGRFDVIVGSDLLYEDAHISLLANFILRHAHTNSEVIIVDPGRGRSRKFIRQMQQQGYQCQEKPQKSTNYLEQPFKGTLLHFYRANSGGKQEAGFG